MAKRKEQQMIHLLLKRKVKKNSNLTLLKLGYYVLMHSVGHQRIFEQYTNWQLLSQERIMSIHNYF
jgi:hypothetical protein